MSTSGPIALIVNPAATKVRAGLRDRVIACIERLERPLSVHVTTAPGDGAILAQAAARDGAVTVVTLGGDGIVNEVLGALLGTDVAVATVPGGNANVFARATGWPRTPAAAVEALEATLRDPHRRSLQMWKVHADETHRLIALNAGMGFDAEAVRRVEAHPELKRRFRHAAFVAAGVAAARAVGRRHPRISVSIDDGEPWDCQTLMLAAGTPYSYLGGRPVDVLPAVDFGGELAWLGLLATDAKTIARVAGGIVLTGGNVPEGVAVRGTATRRIVATADQPLEVQADGEPMGEHRQIVVEPAGRVTVFTPTLKVVDAPPK